MKKDNNTPPVAETTANPLWGGLIMAVGAGVLAYMLHDSPDAAKLMVGEGFVGGTIALAAINPFLRRSNRQ